MLDVKCLCGKAAAIYHVLIWHQAIWKFRFLGDMWLCSMELVEGGKWGQFTIYILQTTIWYDTSSRHLPRLKQTNMGTECLALSQAAAPTTAKAWCYKWKRNRVEAFLSNNYDRFMPEVSVGSDGQTEKRNIDSIPDPEQNQVHVFGAFKKRDQGKKTYQVKGAIHECSDMFYCTVEDRLSVRNSHE